MTWQWNTAACAAALTITVALLTGCSSTALPPGKSVLDVQAARDNSALAVNQPQAAFPAHPSGFDWAGQTLRATGEGKASNGMPKSQRQLAANTSAAAHARASLKEQVKGLPVGTDQTIGSIMNAYSPIRLAVEREVESAKVISNTPGSNGASAEAQVELPMQSIANILQQHQITPDQELPGGNETAPAVGVSNII